MLVVVPAADFLPAPPSWPESPRPFYSSHPTPPPHPLREALPMGSNGVQKLGLQNQFLQDLGLGMEHLEFSHITVNKVAAGPMDP